MPGKNIRQLLGKPLIAYTIEHAQETRIFDCLAVSSDSDDILDVAENWEVDFLIKRPEELATSDAAKIPAIQHAVVQSENRTGMSFDTVVDLDATAPIRTPEDIQAVVDLLETTDAPNVITGVPARRSPYFNLVEETSEERVQLAKVPDKPITRRQDTPNCYDMNASIYAWTRKSLFDSEPHAVRDGTKLYKMKDHQAFDVDSEIDFVIVESIMEHLSE